MKHIHRELNLNFKLKNKGINEMDSKVDSSERNFSKGRTSDPMRVSLSDVVLNSPEKDSNADYRISNCEGYVETFHDVVENEVSGPEGFFTSELDNITMEMKFSDGRTDCKGIPLKSSSSPEAKSVAHSQPLQSISLTQSDDKTSDSFVDFEDVMDLSLLISSLKTDENSGDEFDFDLPTSVYIAGNQKGTYDVFSCGDSCRTGAGDMVSMACGDFSIKDCVKLHDTHSKDESAAISINSHAVIADSEANSIVTAASPLQDGMGLLQYSQEKEDISHIITSSAADWDNVETVEAGFGEVHSKEELMSSVKPLLTFCNIWQHFRSMDHSAVKDRIQVCVEKNGLAAILSWLFGPPRLHKDLLAERVLVFCVAATALDNIDDHHLQSLQTIYRVLTGSRFNCPRYGSHWEEIGFQGQDPATDLRGTGMLALVQLISFLQDDTTSQLARDLYKLSLHPTQNFPFCVMCINISRIALQALREGVLNRECNKQERVMPVVNQLYAGALLYLYRVWKQGKTIKDSGYVIQDVETHAKKHCKELLKALQTFTVSQKSGRDGNQTSGRTVGSASSGTVGTENKEGEANFFSVVMSDTLFTKSAAELY